MLTKRAILFFALSIFCVAALLYYVLLPQGPQLLQWSHPTPVNGEEAMTKETETETVDDMSTKITVSKADKFTPEVLLSAPRRGPAVPNADGSLIAYTVSAYSFDSHKKTTQIHTLDTASGQSSLVASGEKLSSPNWIGADELLFLQPDTGKNATKLVIGNQSGKTYIAATVPASVSEIRVKGIDSQTVAVALVAQANRDGSLYNPAETQQPRSSAKLYDNLMVRHWDQYVTPQRNAIWHGLLQKGTPHITERDGRYTLGELTNVLKGSKLESPIPTFGGADHYDVGLKGVCFVAKDPDINPATNTKSNFYLVSTDFSSSTIKYGSPVKFELKEEEDTKLEGASTSPVFSPDGDSAAFLQMRTNGYESDKNHLLLLDIERPDDVIEMFGSYNGKGLWDRSPQSVTFASDTKALYLTAQDEGTVKLFRSEIPENPRSYPEKPHLVTKNVQVSDVKVIVADSSKLLVSGSSLTDNSFYAWVSVQEKSTDITPFSSLSENGSMFGLSREQVSDIWFEGADRVKVHAWVIKPSSFSSTKKYPLAYLIHGGPQGSWDDSWSTRWNPAIFAEQGYVVITPNPTGSTGYGQQFTDDIQGNWGGRPYQDLVKGFEYIKANLSYVDTEKAVALGASYGGYMMNWIQGQDLANEFKALVCHDGSFNLPAQLSSDEQYFPNHDLGGPPTEDPLAWDEWSPHKHISNWTTPMLVIHNELDYRLPISEGLAMFNVLQEKGVKSRFLTFPDENHWVLNEENSLVWHTVVLNWINSFIGLPEYMDEGKLGIVVQN